MVPPNYPDFPERLDLPRLTDKEAAAALALLRLLVDQGAVDVYTAAGGVRADGRYLWNCWIESHILPGGKRIPLREWAAGVMLLPHHPDDTYTLTEAGRAYLAAHSNDAA
jgi:hypothetical protein